MSPEFPRIPRIPNILEAVSDAVRQGSMAPIQSEIEKAVAPMVETAEQGKQATAMIQVLLNDEETCDLLYDFAERCVKAMHPLDIAEYGLKAASVIVTLIASAAAMIYTGGTGGAGTAGKLLRLAKECFRNFSWNIANSTDLAKGNCQFRIYYV